MSRGAQRGSLVVVAGLVRRSAAQALGRRRPVIGLAFADDSAPLQLGPAFGFVLDEPLHQRLVHLGRSGWLFFAASGERGQDHGNRDGQANPEQALLAFQWR